MSLPDIDMEHLPRHVAVIMDGNGRWAERHGVSRTAGHEAGAESVRAIVEACRELGGIDALTLYAFSTENWRRPKYEVSALFRLLSLYIERELDSIHRQDIRCTIMGRMEDLSTRVIKDLNRCMSLTANNKSMILNIAINYGARTEIADAAKAVARDVQAGTLDVDDIDEASIAQRLYVPELPELDLLIRTSGEMRLSNFMLWQLSYAEIVITPTLWPDFRKRHLYKAIAEYQARHRRFGGR